MKIVIDLQSLQTASRSRGIGRYSLALARAMITEGKKHEFNIILNHNLPDSVVLVKKAFKDILNPDKILTFSVPRAVFGIDADSQRQYKSAELIREYFIEQLKPGFVHVSNLFEDLSESITSINDSAQIPAATTLYDLIPYLHQEIYLENPLLKFHYIRKMDYVRRCKLVLAISENTRREAIEVLGLPAERVINISSDADICFQKCELDEKEIRILKERYKIYRQFVMYTGGINYRKNIEGLIKAFACLTADIRAEHQLVICCRVMDDERKRLTGIISRLGLAEDEIVLTGYVSDDDLVGLYNLCKLFVFPSLYEGFGLPVLEAMRCGAAVIGSNSTSVPEIIGLKDALFDPMSVDSISKKLRQALTNDQFIQRLRENSQIQAAKFSWKNSAQRALGAMEEVHERNQDGQHFISPVASKSKKPRLAYISPLPPEKSGIADYSAELLPELSKFYEIDLVTDLKEISEPWLNANLKRLPVSDFEKSADQYNRVLYHFGNSAFHSHMFRLIKKYPGTVVLHEFFLSGVLYFIEATTPGSTIFREALYRSHGYQAVKHWQVTDPEATVWNYPCCIDVLKNAQGIIVHSEYVTKLSTDWFSPETRKYFIKIPHLRRLPSQTNKAGSRKSLGLPEQALVVCCFGFLGPTKLNELLLESWLSSELSHDDNCYLIFVGGGQGDNYEKSLRKHIQISATNGRIKITGYAEKRTYQHFLEAADIAVQLRTKTRGETSGTVFDCLGHGLATVVNDHGSLAELPNEVVKKLPDQFSTAELVKVVEQLYHDSAMREELGRNGIDYVKNQLDPQQIARQYYEAIESFAQTHPVAVQRRLISEITELPTKSAPGDRELARIAETISENSQPCGTHQLLVDISLLAHEDIKTGIQRVVRSILQQLVTENIRGFRVEAVYRLYGSYCYARRFMQHFLEIPDLGLSDTPVDVSPGDIFLGLDLDPCMKEIDMDWLRYQQCRGLKLHFVIYDLLPLTHPEWFSSGSSYSAFKNWIKSISTISDGLICISRATAEEVGNWLNLHPVERIEPLSIDYFHLGADIEASKPTNGLSSQEKTIIDQISRQINILMVGTIEPRKGYRQALGAFEQIWIKGANINLIIIGKPGWDDKGLLKSLDSHPQKDRHLFWFDKASDELLLNIYQKASALLMVSEGEGFGLPLIEAAKHGLPIIARDLPVFREVAGAHAFYFTGTDSESLTSALLAWLDLYKQNKHPGSQGIKWLTWAESAEQLKKALFSPVSRAVWDPQNGFRWNVEPGSDENAPKA